MTFLLTFTTYGTHLHGDPRGSIDRHRNQPGQPFVPSAPRLSAAEQSLLQSAPVTLTEPHRRLVLDSLKETCTFREWLLVAAHVRTNHVHVIVTAEAQPETLLRDLKAYASRSLNAAEGKKSNRWTRGGSTRALPTREAIKNATRYVIDNQGAPMALYLAPEPPPSP